MIIISDFKQHSEWRSINDSMRATSYRFVGASVSQNVSDNVWNSSWFFVGVYAVILAQKLKEYDFDK